MNQPLRVVITALAGLVAGWSGYWLGHWFGWSENADWPTSLGGGGGAILLSIALAVIGALAVGSLLGVVTVAGTRRRPPSPQSPSKQLR